MDVVERTAHVRIRGPARLAWALLADSERVDRAIGAPPSRYTVQTQRGDLGPLRIGHANTAIGPTTWTETGTWSEGRWFDGTRNHPDGPIATIRYRVDVAADAEGSTVGLRFAVTTRAPEARPIAEAIAEAAMKRLTRLAGEVDRLLADVADEPERAALRVLEPHLLRAPPSLLFRRPQPTHEAALAAGIERLAAADVAAPVRDALAGLLRTGPDEVLAELRPRVIARTLGLAERELLNGCVEAVRAGLLTLEWRPICASCRNPTASKGSLAGLGSEAACLVCAATTPIDAARSLEAVFVAAPAVRRVERLLHCASGLTFRPWVVGGAQLAPHETVEVALPTTAGDLDLGVRGSPAPVATVLAGATDRVEVTFDPAGLVTVRRLTADAPTLVVINRSSGHAEVEARRTDDDPERTLAVDLFALPSFRDVFAGDRPDSGTSLTVGRLAVLFADIVGSTATYTTLGDGPAYALVERYFGVMRAVVDASGGTVVKTMGDAVLAVFPDVQRAIEAAFALHEASAGLLHAHGLALRVGLHEGSCLAVNANGTLDYFGATVNLAARLQGRAGPRETAMTADTADRNVTRLREAPTVREDVLFKGFPASVACARVHHD